MGTAGEIIVLIKFSPKRGQMLGAVNENIEVSSDGNNDAFEKVIALTKLSVTRWVVRANAFNKVNSLYSCLRTDFCIFSASYFSIFLTFHFGFGNNYFFV